MRLQLSNISKSFGALKANDNISLSLAKGEVLALLGENGAGKTTLMNILFGHYVADQGSIQVDGKALPPGTPQAALKAGIGMVHQHFTLADNLSVLDNITLGAEPLFQLWRDKNAAQKKLADLSNRFGLQVNPDAMVASLSVGEKQRVEILKALYCGARILILDEPTAVLTPQESEQLFATLKQMVQQDLSILFISHKLHEILAISNRVAVLRRGKLVDEVATKQATKASLASSMVGREVNRPSVEPMEQGNVVAELKNVSLGAVSGSVPLRATNLKIHQHEIVGVAGVAGNGQAGLAALFNGQAKPSSGAFLLYGTLLSKFNCRSMVAAGVARIPEDRSADGVVGEMQLWENLLGEQLQGGAKRRFIIDRESARLNAEKLIEQFDIRCEGPEAQTNLLSGGNMQKLILARNLSKQPKLVIANQPIRGLDEGAIAYVQSQLIEAKQNGAGILLISEDLDELFGIADRIAVICQGQLQGPFDKAELNIEQVGLMMSGAAYEEVAA